MPDTKDDLHRRLNQSLCDRTVFGVLAPTLLLLVLAVNSLWFFPGFVKSDGATVIVVASVGGVFAAAFFLGLAIGFGGVARRLGRRLMKEHGDDIYFR